MLLHIVRKELLDQMLSLRFAIACVICLLVFLLSFGLMTREYLEATSAYNMNKVAQRNELLNRTNLSDLRRGHQRGPPFEPAQRARARNQRKAD